jgi:hypothetical protein
MWFGNTCHIKEWCDNQGAIHITTSVPNYKTLFKEKIVPFYKTPLVVPITLIIFLPTYPCLFCIFFFNQQQILCWKHKLTLSLKDKFVKTIVIIYKFNTTTDFLNSRDFGKRVIAMKESSLEWKLIYMSKSCTNRNLTSNSSRSCFNIFSTSENSLIDPRLKVDPSNCIVFKQFAISVNSDMPFKWTLKHRKEKVIYM